MTKVKKKSAKKRLLTVSISDVLAPEIADIPSRINPTVRERGLLRGAFSILTTTPEVGVAVEELILESGKGLSVTLFWTVTPPEGPTCEDWAFESLLDESRVLKGIEPRPWLSFNSALAPGGTVISGSGATQKARNEDRLRLKRPRVASISTSVSVTQRCNSSSADSGRHQFGHLLKHCWKKGAAQARSHRKRQEQITRDWK